METWAWLIAYLLGFALLQLYLYRYFIGGESTANSSAENATPGFDGSAGPVSPDDIDSDPDGEYVNCAQCGGHNEADAVFTYCRHCGARL
ncbi:hypothetical protein GRX03_05530 [Halovenus sp. WSH3]|uniref:DUF7577 domain-containing protein n=1 Tax=Halovenus carboxidivorans TaxID=2692199 RepID=A0A6B0T1N0_9EURY|nr:hypothetical protein [Halovenus carboxidivorans]MXR51067.1 hypothetical protein [Halovenus carboxidivorans]